MNIRPATAKDATILAALAIQIWLHTYAEEGVDHTTADYVVNEFTPQNFRELIQDDTIRILIAEVADHAVAYAVVDVASPCPSNAALDVELDTLYVQEYFAGQGIGRALVASIAKLIQAEKGHTDFWLAAYYQNENALAFYRKLGFVEIGTTVFEMGEDQYKNLVLAYRPESLRQQPNIVI